MADDRSEMNRKIWASEYWIRIVPVFRKMLRFFPHTLREKIALFLQRKLSVITEYRNTAENRALACMEIGELWAMMGKNSKAVRLLDSACAIINGAEIEGIIVRPGKAVRVFYAAARIAHLAGEAGLARDWRQRAHFYAIRS